MATASLLLPIKAAAYIYNDNTIIGHVTLNHDTFEWEGHTVHSKVGEMWLLVNVTADTADDTNRLARYQADRIMSGLYPCYVKEA